MDNEEYKVKCQNCDKLGEWELHPCPFQINVYGEDPDNKEYWCNCCPDCTDKCIDEV